MSLTAYLPHRPPALLVTEILSVKEGGSVCLARVPVDSPFVLAASETFPTYLALEMGAQAAAACEALQRASEGEPRAGFVVRVNEARFHRAVLPVDADYRVTTSLVRAAPPLRVWRVRVELEEDTVAEGELVTYATELGSSD